MTKPNREQSGLYNLFTRYVKDDGTIHNAEFANDVKALRKTDDISKPTYENIEEIGDSVNADEIPSPLTQFMWKYGLPNSMADFLYHFITHEKIDLDKLQSGIYLVDDDAMQASGTHSQEQNFKNYIEDTQYAKYIQITLAVPVEATNVQIKQTIADSKDFIKSRQVAIGGSQVRNRENPMAERDNMIMSLYSQGLKPREIVGKLPEKWDGLTRYDVSKIVDRAKRKQQ